MRCFSYGYTAIEIPDELSFYLLITGCKKKCPGCHSRHLWREESGWKLIEEKLVNLFYLGLGVASCVLFMGGEWHPEELKKYLEYARGCSFKTALYTGCELEEIPKDILNILDYIKVGKYNFRLGPLRKKTTNQRLYKLLNGEPIEDITSKFWKGETK